MSSRAQRGEKSEPAEVHAEHRDLASRDEPRAAQQRAVAAEREQRVDARRIARASRAVLHDVVQLLLEHELESERRRERDQPLEHRRKPIVAQMADDAEADHPATASVS